MNWIITLKNQSGLITSVGYTHKTQEQIEQIKNKFIAQGLKIVKVTNR